MPANLAPEPELLFIIGGRDPSGLAKDVQVIARKFRLARIVVIGDRIETRGVILALEAGAHGYLGDNMSSEALVKSLELVMLDETVLPAEFAKGLPTHLAHIHDAPRSDSPGSEMNDQRLPTLSSREQAILKKLAAGASNKVIAYDLAITEATVKVHVKSILRKVHVRNRTQAAIWAVTNGTGSLKVSDEPISAPAAANGNGSLRNTR